MDATLDYVNSLWPWACQPLWHCDRWQFHGKGDRNNSTSPSEHGRQGERSTLCSVASIPTLVVQRATLFNRPRVLLEVFFFFPFGHFHFFMVKTPWQLAEKKPTLLLLDLLKVQRAKYTLPMFSNDNWGTKISVTKNELQQQHSATDYLS